MAETAPARRAPTDITEAARHDFDVKQVEAIRRTVARDCSPEEFVIFMEIVGRYGLDPFTNQIWAVKYPGRNGSQGRVTFVVGRDGFLAIAQRYPDFAGLEGDVVRENDEFGRRAGGEVHHAYSGSPAGRGPIVGAWAKAYRTGRVPSYFFAPMDQYKGPSGPWKQYPDAMILKVAESVVLRKQFSISGVVHEAEVVAPSGDAALDEPDWGDPDMEARLRAAFGTLRWRPRKQRMTLRGLDGAGREALLARLEADAIREDPGPEPGPEPVEAEVVDESEAAWGCPECGSATGGDCEICADGLPEPEATA